MAEWVRQLALALARAGRAVVVTVAHAAGSTPREAGTTMIVTEDDIAGTIGGGHLEYVAIGMARDALTNAALPAPWVVRFPLAARVGQCCGGVATLAFSALDASKAVWVDKALACVRGHTAFTLVSRIGGNAGYLLVTLDDSTGSLGDALLDSTGVALARQRLQADATGASLANVAAGAATTLLLHVVSPRPFDVLVFGNGHVGRALVQVLGALPARVRWIDEREDEFPVTVPGNVEIVATNAPEDLLRHAPRGAYVVVMTHSHALDFDLIESALRRDDWQYVGLIGSRSKRSQFEKRLVARGVAPDVIARVVCPIGIGPSPGLSSKEPGVIAVAVAAELLALRERTGRQYGPATRSSDVRSRSTRG